jgi:hypothetical protein
MPINNNKKILAIAFLIGLAVAIADSAYFKYAYDHQIMTPDGLWLLLLCLDPPSFLSVMFIDVQPTAAQVVTLEFVVALLNATLYASVTAGLLRIKRRTA